MSTPPKKQSSVYKQDKSDVLSLLLSIESMYVACQNVLNTYTQTTLMLSMTIEAQMLLMKLQVMKDRWQYHLPFKEACTVDFYDWSKKIEKMSLSMVSSDEDSDTSEPMSEYCPSKHYMLDLYEKYLEEQSLDNDDAYFYRELSIPRFIAAQDKIRKQIIKHWSKYKYEFSDMIARKLDERIGDVLMPLAGKSVVIRMTCCEVLQQLSLILYQLYEMPSGVIQRDQFARLAERVINEFEYGGRKAQKNALRDFENLKNTTPEEVWKERCEGEIKASIDIINEMKYGSKVFPYLGRNCDIRGRYAGMGKFLNSIRRDISEEELVDLVEQLFRLQYFREEMEQLEATVETETVSKVEETAVNGKRKDANAIYQYRMSKKPARPKLPIFFSERLADNAEAVSLYYDTLHHCGFYIGRTLLEKEKRNPKANCYANWKWIHLREAFMNLGFIRKDSTKKGFAEHLESALPYLEAGNVIRGFNSRGNSPEPVAFDRIVSDIEYEFQCVKDMID